MTKMNKTNKLMASVVAMIMAIVMVGCMVVAQASFAAAKDAGLQAHEQVMDDSNAAATETVALAADEQVVD